MSEPDQHKEKFNNNSDKKISGKRKYGLDINIRIIRKKKTAKNHKPKSIMLILCPVCESSIQTPDSNIQFRKTYYYICPSCENKLSFEWNDQKNTSVISKPVHPAHLVNRDFDPLLKGMKRNYFDLSYVLVEDYSHLQTITNLQKQEKEKPLQIGVTKRTEENIEYNQKSNENKFTDSRDGQVYRTVKIGHQIWMAENLNYDTGRGSFCYDNDSDNCKSYGRLYTWEAAKRAVPYGWRLPTEDDFELLIAFLASKTYHYDNLVDIDRFHLVFSGYRNIDGNFGLLGDFAYFWSLTEGYKINESTCLVCSIKKKAYISHYDKSYGFSVRCIRED